MKKKNNSFRTKIIIALVIVVSSVTFSAFYIYNNSLNKILHEEHDKDTISVLTLLKGQFYRSLGTNEGKIIYKLLDFIRLNPNINNAYLLNSEKELIYPKNINPSLLDSLNLSAIIKADSSIFLENVNSNNRFFTRAYIPLQNSTECYACHTKSNTYLGTIVVDLKEENESRSVDFTKIFSFFFTLIILVIIGITIMIMHYKFVKNALREFHDTIDLVNEGEIYRRISIPETKELGKLGYSFNTMLDNFQKAQKELQTFHKNELRNNYKLATIGEMASRLAHEIRNPITGIANAIEVIQSEVSDEKTQAILDEILRQANRVNQAISDLLKYSRQKDVNLKESDINDVIRRLIFFFENQALKKDIIFKDELQDNLPVFKFDNAQLEDVLLNIGLNAIHSMGKTGTLVFKSGFDEKERMIKISISDSGKGISETIQAKIFHPFFTTKSEGTGLGLAIAKDIIAKHKGEIWVENNSGPGCTFNILLPTNNEEIV